MEVNVGMKRRQWINVLSEALYRAENDDSNFEFTIYGINNSGPGEVVIKLDNDDMERDETPDKACYVEVNAD